MEKFAVKPGIPKNVSIYLEVENLTVSYMLTIGYQKLNSLNEPENELLNLDQRGLEFLSLNNVGSDYTSSYLNIVKPDIILHSKTCSVKYININGWKQLKLLAGAKVLQETLDFRLILVESEFSHHSIKSGVLELNLPYYRL